MRRVLALLGAVVPVLLLGCGGGGGGSSADSTTAATPFAQAADAACVKADREVSELAVPASSAQLIRYLGKTEAIVVRLRRRIEELGPSDGPARAYLEGLQQSSTVLNEMFDAGQSENPDAVGELSRALAGLRLGRLARQAGLDVCAKPLEPTA